MNEILAFNDSNFEFWMLSRCNDIFLLKLEFQIESEAKEI